MSDPFGREKPLRKSGRKSHASKRARAERAARADERALQRFTVVDFALKLLRSKPELSLGSVFALVKQAHSDGELQVTRLPGRASFYRWMKIALQEKGRVVSVGDFLDRPRSGRPRTRWHPRVLLRFEEMVLSQMYPSLPLLYEDLIKWAKQQVPELPVPSLQVVRARFDSFDLAALSAARHGRRAARADSIVKSSVPTDYPHQIWTLDELEAPIWIKTVHPISGRLVSVRPFVILIVDNHSRAILAAHVCEPFKGGAVTVGFDSEDVLGAFFSAVFRELALESCKAFTGYLPQDVRLDSAKQHNALKVLLRKHRIGAANLEIRAPWSRGNIEALIGRFKDLCYEIPGHMSWSLPADQLRQDQREARSVAAATTARIRRRAVIAVEDLLSLEEFRERLEVVVRRYNTKEHRILGVSPETRYQNDLRSHELRPASDALFMLEPVVLTVGATGIEHRNKKFMPIAGGVRLAVGTQVLCRPDPLRRGLFAEIDGATYFLPESIAWAREQSAADVVREQKAIAADYSETAADAFDRLVKERLRSRQRQRQVVDDMSVGTEQRPRDPDMSVAEVAASPIEQELVPLAGSTSRLNTEPQRQMPIRHTRSVSKAVAAISALPQSSRGSRRELPRGVVRPTAGYLRLID